MRNNADKLSLDEVEFLLQEELHRRLSLGGPMPQMIQAATFWVGALLEDLHRSRQITEIPKFRVYSDDSELKVDFLTPPEKWIFQK